MSLHEAQHGTELYLGSQQVVASASEMATSRTPLLWALTGAPCPCDGDEGRQSNQRKLFLSSPLWPRQRTPLDVISADTNRYGQLSLTPADRVSVSSSDRERKRKRPHLMLGVRKKDNERLCQCLHLIERERDAGC